MADQLVELTRVDGDQNGVPVLINLASVAWLESNKDGSTHVTFTVALAQERANGEMLSIDVRESLKEIAGRAGIVKNKIDNDIAQAWADQTARRDQDNEER